MKNILLLIQTVVAITCNSACAQTVSRGTTTEENVIRFEIKPSATDSSIKAFDAPHLVLYKSSAKQGKLLLFLPGTNGIAVKGPADFFNTAMEQGYRVISLSYIDTPAVSQVCIGNTLISDPDCAEAFRTKRIYGVNAFSLIPDEPQDAIMNRITKLLIYLTRSDKQGNWGVYLKNGVPKWELIAVTGQSQGGGMSAFIAKKILVARMITFSGGWDYSAKNKIAGWYFKQSVTPPDRWYGTYHTLEPAAATIAETYKAMAIPDNHIYPLSLEVRPGRKAHGEGVWNTAYKQQWIEMLGTGY